MNICGARTSCSIISMACVNLGTEICHKAENMYIMGIITGPHEPSLAELNHYIGIHFSRTSLYTCSAIAASINNLPAARKASRLASHGSHFYCTTDFWMWTLHDKHKLREYATQWRDVTTSTKQEKIFHLHGVRWSELWQLSYWNPTCQLVVDSMHCILEGLVRYHSMDVLELTTMSSLAKAKDIPSFDHHFQCLEILKIKLLKLNTEPLKFVCTDIGCLPVRRTGKRLKCDYAKALVAWNTVTPLWINPVPYNFRDPAAAIIYLPITLVTFWGTNSSHPTPAIMNHTMSLFSATHLVCMQVMTKSHMVSYHDYIAMYWLPHNHKFGEFNVL
ncbi:hypothetical protein K439DRAFT_1650019 [Ramaria rubella]|nr:hypothetical protein K439DRAFT_1650019 [Ramaria rubella]